MTKSKALIQILLALVLAVGGGLMVFNWASGQRQATPTPVQAEKTVPVVVAARPLSRGMELTEPLLKVVQYPGESAPMSAFAEPDELEGRILDAPLETNEPVTVNRLASENLNNAVSAIIAPGHRAMAVKGNKVMGLAGFIRPGDRVDVLVTMTTEAPNATSFTKLVLSDILVLATGTEFQSGPQGEPSSVDTYSLEVDPEESELLALAANYGTLNFALRKEGDDSRVLTRGADVAATLAANRMPERKRPRARARSSSGPKVEIITGTERSVQQF